jgi:hypothetical protein
MKKLLSALLIGGSLLVAQSAAATDYCVNTACGGTVEPTFEDALLAAGTATNADRIFLGSGIYTAPGPLGFVYVAPDSPVEVIGAGAGQTVLTAPTLNVGVFTLLGSPDNNVHDLTIRSPLEVAQSATALETSGTARRIAVTESASQFHARTAVFLESGGTLEDSSVAIGSGQTTTGVQFGAGGGTVRDSSVTARTGVEATRAGLIERSRITALDDGVLAASAPVTIRSSLITVTGDLGFGIKALVLPGGDTKVDADGLTIVGPGAPQSAGVFAVTAAADNVDVTLRNSIVRNFGHALQALSVASGAAAITASHSDYDATTNDIGPVYSKIVESDISHFADPGFTNVVAGDYRLTQSSSLIDAGDPAAGDGLDLDRNPLLADGNSDGMARRDIGAFEFQPAPPLPPAAPIPAADPPPAPTGSGAADTRAPLVSGFASSRKAFAVGRARTAVSALARGTRLRYTLSEPAKVTVSVRRVGSARVAGKLLRSGRAGANTLKFSGRIGARALKPGRYRAVITARDAAGNRSVARHVTFRILHA